MKQQYGVGDKVMGFVTIRTGRRELRKGTVVQYERGVYKLDIGVEATARELVRYDQARLKAAAEVWSAYHEAQQKADRLYAGTMSVMYQKYPYIDCVKTVPNAPFEEGRRYAVAKWALEGLYAFPADATQEELLVARTAPGEDLMSDPFFRRHFRLVRGCDDSDTGTTE